MKVILIIRFPPANMLPTSLTGNQSSPHVLTGSISVPISHNLTHFPIFNIDSSTSITIENYKEHTDDAFSSPKAYSMPTHHSQVEGNEITVEVEVGMSGKKCILYQKTLEKYERNVNTF